MMGLIGHKTGRHNLILLILLLLGLLFFVDHASLQLASDDFAWLQGEAPTVFDQYRKLPRLLFVSLHALAGPSAAAALGMIFAFHTLNTVLLYRLGFKVLEDRTASLVAAAVFAINPITLQTLTWISCFSYVLGTSLALLALLAFWQATDEPLEAPGGGAPSAMGRRKVRLYVWPAFALLCFGAGLFCSHEIFFLPGVFLALGWFRRKPKMGVLLFVLGMALALVVNLAVYDFGRYGVETSSLLSFDFALAFGSSGLSSGLSLALAYPLSFFARTLSFLQFSFTEPVRWVMTLVLLSASILLYRDSRAWRLYLAMALSFLALITPYIIRLYLTPDTVNFHISYALSGRVFYLPFTMLALTLGWLVSRLFTPFRGKRWAWLIAPALLIAYGHALLYYDRADFLGLNVALEDLPQRLPPRWNPYDSQQPIWCFLVTLILGALVLAQFLIKRTDPPKPNPDSVRDPNI